MAASREVTRSLAKIAVSTSRLRCLATVSQIPVRCMATASSGVIPTASSGATPSTVGHAGAAKVEKISQAMKAYLERAQAHDKFMTDETTEYEIGKRHLANIMGQDPDTFTQEDIDKAIEYLLPSGLFDKRARPQMRHPTVVIPQRKAAQFGMDGRPFHSLFYTGFPNYFQLTHEAAVKYEKLKEAEHKSLKTGTDQAEAPEKLILAGSQWVSKKVLEDRLNEKLSDAMYDGMIHLLERVAEHPCALVESDFIFGFRKKLQSHVQIGDSTPLMYDEIGRGYTDGEGIRKRAQARVRIWEKGDGRIQINNQNLIDYFPRLLEREQLVFPLHFTNKLGEVDIIASVEGGGVSGQAGALRLAMARALQSMVDKEMVEKMRLAGLLTKDPRRRERKKPGQEGARRKFTWKKR